MNLREIECFIAVADELHFGRAADRLHLAQPTVSESVRRLERHIGGQLFDRSTRNVLLTELGAVFLKEARDAYAHVATAYETGRRLAHRRECAFNVGATSGDEDLVIAATAALTRGRPAVTVHFEDMSSLVQMEAVLHRRIDVGLAWVPPRHPEINTLVLGRTGYVAVVPESSRLARLTTISMTRLAGEPLITWARVANPALYDRFANSMTAACGPWSLVATASGVANLMARVISGQGIGIVPSTAFHDRRIHGIKLVPVGPGGPYADRTVIWLRESPHLMLAPFVKATQRAWAQYRSEEHLHRQLG